MEVEKLQGHEDWIQAVNFSALGLYLVSETNKFVLVRVFHSTTKIYDIFLP